MAEQAIPQTKVCTKCGKSLPLNSYTKKKNGLYGLRSCCRACTAAQDAARRSADREKGRISTRLWREKNPDAAREYYLRNREKILAQTSARQGKNRPWLLELQRIRRAKNRDHVNATASLYREANREKVRKATRRHDRKRRSTPRGRLENAISAGLSASLARRSKAGRSWQTLVGYSLDDLVVHLEQKFLPGMNWENYGDWHVDHVIPKSAFNYSSPEHADFRRCWALSNLQPLWAEQNIKKRDAVPIGFQASLAF